MAGERARRGGTARHGSPERGLSIVVPLFNESGNIAALHARLLAVGRELAQTRGLRTEVVYVDDGSRDDTLAKARALAADGIDLQLVSLSRNGRELIDRLALIFGLILAPLFAYFEIGLGLLLAGLAAGTLAYIGHRLKRAR